jgi:hypothetical protein
MLRNNTLSRLQIIQIALIAVGVVLLIAGANLESNGIINLGLLLGGAGTLSSGIDTLVSNRVSFWSYLFADLYGSGVRAILAGALLVVVGIWLWTLALIRLLGLQQQAGSYLAFHPGVILVNIALLLFLWAAIVLLRLEGWRASLENVLRAVPLVLGGGFILVAALCLLLIGLYALISPDVFNAWLKGLLSSF